MRADDDPLLPPHWLVELGDGLGEPLLRSLWNTPAPEPVASAPANANLTVRWQPNQPPEFVVPPIALRMGGRLQPLLQVAQLSAALLSRRRPDGQLVVQLHDEDPGPGSLRMDAPRHAAKPQNGVIPDAYCLGSHGFLLLRQQLIQHPLPPWQARKSIACWRGASTDSKQITLTTLGNSRRYQLCQLTRRRPDLLDARFSNVVQCASASDQQAVEQHLREQHLLAPRLEPLAMAQCRWLLDLDGNVNSWGLLWKLLSGCCVIRVSSSRGQWFHHRLIPGRHLVAVQPDLNDLEDKLSWCQEHPQHCEAIAHEGQQLARQILEDLGADVLTAIRAVTP